MSLGKIHPEITSSHYGKYSIRRNYDGIEEIKFQSALDLLAKNSLETSNTPPQNSPRVIPGLKENYITKANNETKLTRIEKNLYLALQLLNPFLKTITKQDCILVVSCGTNSKCLGTPDDLRLKQVDLSIIEHVKQERPWLIRPAKEMYTGYHHRLMTNLSQKLANHYSVNRRIVSAAWGLLKPDQEIPTYDYTFIGKSDPEVFQSMKQSKLFHYLQVAIDRHPLSILQLSHSYRPLLDYLELDRRTVLIDLGQSEPSVLDH